VIFLIKIELVKLMISSCSFCH